MALLKNAVITDGDNVQSAQKKIDNLKTFRDAIAKAIPLPGVQGKYAKGKASEEPALPGQAATLDNLPKGRVPMINPQGKPVTLPATQVQKALAAGYKPYQP